MLIAVLGSGSSGNVTLVSDGTVHVLLDLGLAARETERRLADVGIRPSSIHAILLSHEHDDHARGAFRFAGKHRIPLFATEGAFRLGRARFAKDRKGKETPVEWLRLKSDSGVKLGGLVIEPFKTPHDAVEPIGFVIREGKLRFSHVTDIGHISRSVEEALEGSHAMLIESNHDVDMLRRGPYPDSLKQRVGGHYGHLSNEALAAYVARRLPATVEHLFLAHLSNTNNHESLAIASCRQALRYRSGPRPTLHLTYHDRATPVLRLRARRPVEVDERQGVLAFDR